MAEQMTLQHLMARLGGEAILGRLMDAIESVAVATDETGQAGKVVLTIKTFKEKGSEKRDRYVGFETRLVAVPPSPSARSTGLYVDEDGIYASDPRQQQMDLRAVESGDPETRAVAVGQPEVRRA